MEQSTFQPGDICLECQQQGLNNRLRTFYINLNEQIVKCESSLCLYPYENDLSDGSDDDIKEFEKIPSDYTNLSTVPPPINEVALTNDLDDTESVRFVEALLCIGNKPNAAAEVARGGNSSVNDVTKYPYQTSTTFEPSTTLTSTSTSETSASSPFIENPIKYELNSNSNSNDAFNVTEGVSFIDALFSGCNANDTATLTEKSVQSRPQNGNEMSTHYTNMPTFSYNLTDLSTSNNAEHLKTEVKNEVIKPKIEIQSVQDIKTEILPYSFIKGLTNVNKYNKNTTKEIKIKQEKAPAVACVNSNISSTITTTSITTQAANVGNSENQQMRISRYFDTLRMTQKKLEKSNIILESKKRSYASGKQQKNQKRKLESGSVLSLKNVLQVLQTKKQK